MAARHTMATELLMSGIPVRVVSERLGHANSSVTQDIYGHVLPHAQAEAVSVIDRLLERVSKSGQAQNP